MVDIDKLQKVIALKQQELVQLAGVKNYVLTDSEVCQKSRELDILIVKYMKQIKAAPVR